jgi:methyl-accepting chemotaxis protein
MMMLAMCMWLQDVDDSISSGNSRLLMLFVGIVAFSMLTQAIVFVVAAIGAAKARNRLMAIAEEARLKVLPAIDKTHELVHDLHPKMKVIADNLVETSHIVRTKAQEFDSTVTDVNQKTRAQAARVDDMVTSVLNTTEHIASTIQKGVQIPVTQFSGLMNGLKAGLETLMGRGKSAPPRHHDTTIPFERGTTRASGYGVKDSDIGL